MKFLVDNTIYFFEENTRDNRLIAVAHICWHERRHFPDAERAGKTSVSFAEQRRNEVATVFSDFSLLVLLVLLLVPVYK